MCKLYYNAFTLAEVLIVLTIIGIIASMTIPGLLGQSKDLEMKAAWKKGFSDLNQIFNNVILEEGDLSNVCTGGVAFKDTFVKYVKPLNKCGSGVTPGCFSAFSTTYKSLTGQSVSAGAFDDGQVLLANGAFVMFENPYNSYSDPVCVAWYDVNGYKKAPNQLGRDVFGVQFLKNKIVPLGSPDSTLGYATNCDRSDPSINAGMACAAYVLRNQDY